MPAEDTTLYAKWSEIVVPPEPEPSPESGDGAVDGSGGYATNSSSTGDLLGVLGFGLLGLIISTVSVCALIRRRKLNN